MHAQSLQLGRAPSNMQQLLVVQVPALQALLRRVTAQIGASADDGSVEASGGDSTAAGDQVHPPAAAALSLLLPPRSALHYNLHSRASH